MHCVHLHVKVPGWLSDLNAQFLFFIWLFVTNLLTCYWQAFCTAPKSMQKVRYMYQRSIVQWHRFFGLVFINKTLAWSMNDDWMIAGNINSGAILNRNLSPKGLADNEINKNYCSCYQTVSNRSLTSWVNSVHYIIVTYPSNTLHKWMALTLGDIELQLIKLTGHSFNQLRTIISNTNKNQ